MRKVCKKCKMFVEGDTCPSCKEGQFSDNWKGRIYVADPNRSIIAQKIGLKMKGEYAIKVK